MPAPKKPADDRSAPDGSQHGEALARLFQELEDDRLRDESMIDDPSPEATQA